MAYNYSSFVSALSTETGIPATDANFLAVLPQIIDDAEQRIYRELDLVSTSVTVTGSVSANNRIVAIPQGSGHIIVLDAINVIDGSSIRHPVTPATRESVDFCYPSTVAPSTPSYPSIFARIDDTNILVGPSADQAYSAEFVGTIRPTPLSNTNTTTFLTSYLSDLFFAAAMVSAAAYMRNFGAMADDPKMATTWKSEYQDKLASARTEELRKSYVTSMSRTPAASKDA